VGPRLSGFATPARVGSLDELGTIYLPGEASDLHSPSWRLDEIGHADSEHLDAA
jgi:hypothetical protein